jgi:hypothetical protein
VQLLWPRWEGFNHARPERSYPGRDRAEGTANQPIAADPSKAANERDHGSSNNIETVMKDFPNASFPPEMIGIMEQALDAAVATLPEPVSSAHVQSIAETILRTAKDGERDPKTLQRMALIELQISPRHE